MKPTRRQRYFAKLRAKDAGSYMRNRFILTSKADIDFVIKLLSSPPSPPTPTMIKARALLKTIKNNAI